MPRAFLVVLDSVGIGGAPDAYAYFNDGVPDTGANTLGHIAEACAAGRGDGAGRFGPLHLPNLEARRWSLPAGCARRGLARHPPASGARPPR